MLNTGLHVAAKKLGNKAQGASMSLEEYIANTRPPRASWETLGGNPRGNPGEMLGESHGIFMDFPYPLRQSVDV